MHLKMFAPAQHTQCGFELTIWKTYMKYMPYSRWRLETKLEALYELISQETKLFLLHYNPVSLRKI